MDILGIDVGGTGIKANIVDTKSGTLKEEKFKIKTPVPATPDSILESLKTIIEHFNWEGKRVGIGFPAVIKDGISMTASNIDPQFINYDLNARFSEALKCDVRAINDADVAGIAEMKFGKGIGVKGLVIFLTLGTGIGSAVFYDGKLLANTELGHLKYKKSIFEKYASNSARERLNLSWKKWGKELDIYLNHLYLLLNPDLILIGGGVSKHFEMYKTYIDVPTTIDTASLLNDAGIIGAAISAVK